MVTINQSIVLIALPNVFGGIQLNPLQSNNTSYLLWMMMGFMVATAVLVVAFGRLGDMLGRVRMYNLGFAVFTVFSILLSVTWMHGTSAALWLIIMRILQGIGGALLFANSTAILTDAFPAQQRGTALGINSIAGIAGTFLGLILGGVLAPHSWRLVFLVSVPFGIFGTIWAYIKLHDTGVRKPARMDWWGNITFGIGLIVLLVGITYGIQPYRNHAMGWTNPSVVTELIIGVVLLIAFTIIETKVRDPLFRLSLFGIRAFGAGNIASLLTSLGRGGLQFMLIIWLQGIWLPQHGYSFEDTPLWAGIYMIPLTVGFLVAAPLAGYLSDKFGAKIFTVGGALVTAVSFALLLVLPVNFPYWAFALILLVNGFGSGMFASPNRVEMMNSLPADQRGAGSGMIATFQNSAMVLSIGLFFSLMVAGLSSDLPNAMHSGLTQQGVPDATAAGIAGLPPLGVLFAAFLGYNPMQQLLGPILHTLPHTNADYLTGRSFFPHLITDPFQNGLVLAFTFAIVACVAAALASALTGRRRSAEKVPQESFGEELLADVDEILVNVATPNPSGDSDGPPPTTHQLTGTVRDRAGQPIGGAVITVVHPNGQQLGRAHISAAGTFSLDHLPIGNHLVIASAPDWEPVAVLVTGRGARTTITNLVMEKHVAHGRGAVTGVVRSPYGDALEGMTTIVVDDAGEVAGSATTSSDGRYQIHGLANGRYTVTANGHRPATTTVHLQAGESISARLQLVAGSDQKR